MPEIRNRSLPGRLVSYIFAGILGMVSVGANAAPIDGLDPFGKLLAEKGLLPQSVDGRVASHTTTDNAATQGGFASALRDRASEMVLTAMNFLGVPYLRGGNDADTGFDCSGFTRHIFERSIGLVLPRRAEEQANAAGMLVVQRNELRPGDLVFFNTLRRTFSHVGIYVGDGRFIHAPKPGTQVRVESMNVSYWDARFTGARRAVQTTN